jgi:formate hydrogenlyase transcriptional activator
VWVALPDGSNTYVNSRFVDYSGMSTAQTTGAGWQAAIHPDDLDRHDAKWRASIESGEPHESEVRFRRADGQYRWHLDRGLPLRDEDGKIIKWYGVVTDIEDRKQVEEALRRSEYDLQQRERELHEVLDFTPQLIAVTGSNRERLYANRFALEYLDISLDEWKQRSIGSEIHPDDLDRLMSHVERSWSNGSAYEMELRIRKGDGSYRWFLARYNPVRNNDGQISRWYVACTDIDDRKRAEEKLQEENVALREENRQGIDVRGDRRNIIGIESSTLSRLQSRAQ